MSLTRYYPPCSDRMAILWSLIPIRDAIVLEYGPAGTTHFGGGLYGSLGLDLENALFTTHLREDDVVMGDTSRLEAAIEELDAAYAPKVIFVVASAVIAVIGTDIRGVCSYMQDRVRARLITFDDGGFRGDYTYGLRAVYGLFAKEMIQKAERQEGTYLILGASAGSWRIRSDVWEIQNLMQEAFGWRCLAVPGLETGVEELAAAGGAALSLVIRQEAVPAGRQLEERLGIPRVEGAPYGYLGTLAWLERISAVIGVPVGETLRERLMKKAQQNRPFMGGPMGSMRRRTPRAAVAGDYDVLRGLQQALGEMEIAADPLVCLHSLKEIQKPENPDAEMEMKGEGSHTAPSVSRLHMEQNKDPQMEQGSGLHTAPIRERRTERERIELFESLSGYWILGSAETRQTMGPDNYFTMVSAPAGGTAQIAGHLPLMGEKGMDALMEEKEAAFAALGI